MHKVNIFARFDCTKPPIISIQICSCYFCKCLVTFLVGAGIDSEFRFVFPEEMVLDIFDAIVVGFGFEILTRSHTSIHDICNFAFNVRLCCNYEHPQQEQQKVNIMTMKTSANVKKNVCTGSLP